MKKIAILGGGVAGMSAAHELAERGFSVDVFDRNPVYVGGKARSVNVQGTNIIQPDGWLPGEHGFRFFPGFYKHVTDTMKRIPFSEGKSVFDNLVSTDSVMIAQTGLLSIKTPVHFPKSLDDIKELFEGYSEISSEIGKDEIHFFAERIWQLMTSCQERFLDEYESISWWEYLKADNYSDTYRSLLVEGLTRSLVACQAKTASTKTVGTIFLQLIYLMMNPNKNTTDRVLNGPTNAQWLSPWLQYLKSLQVNYYQGKNIVKLHTQAGQISSVDIVDVQTGGVSTISGYDYYLLSVPVERAAALMSQEVLSLDKSLEDIIKLAPNVQWMNGIQFYLNKPLDLNRGHVIYANSNWALTSISQIQFWTDYELKNKGNGKVVAILSVDISDWNSPGNFNQKPAKDCTIEEVKIEVLKQLQQELNVKGQTVLTEDMVEFVYLDKDIHPIEPKLPDDLNEILPGSKIDHLQSLNNREPLLVNQTNTWTLRPNAYTAIPNLFLAGDYVKTYTDLATMEGANESARRAVNNILRASGSDQPLCALWTMDQPWLLGLFQAEDKKHFEQGLHWQHPFVEDLMAKLKEIGHEIGDFFKKVF